METVYQQTLRLLSSLRGYYDLHGVQLLMKHHRQNLEQYFKCPDRTVWTNLAMPQEIFHAMGLPTLFVENMSAILAASRKSIEPLKAASEKLFNTGFCTYITCSLGVLEKEYLPPPRLFIVPSEICEETPKVFEYLAHQYQKDCFFIDIPFSEDEQAVAYIAGQLKDMVRFIEEKTGVKLKEERLKLAIRRSNEAAGWAKKFYEIRKESPPLMYGSSGLRMLGLYSKFGLDAGTEIFRNIYEELEDRANNNTSPVTKVNHRLLWLHLFPYYQNDLMHFIEKKYSSAIVYEENNNYYFDPLDENQPYESLARKFLSLPTHGPVERRVENVLRLTDDFKPDAVIHFSHIGCKVACGGVPFIKKGLREKGVPFLELSGDNIDFRNYSHAQMETRLEAFFEMLN